MWWIFVKIFDLIKNCTLILNYFAVMYKTSHIVQCVTLSDILSNKIYIWLNDWIQPWNFLINWIMELDTLCIFMEFIYFVIIYFFQFIGLIASCMRANELSLFEYSHWNKVRLFYFLHFFWYQFLSVNKSGITLVMELFCETYVSVSYILLDMEDR